MSGEPGAEGPRPEEAAGVSKKDAPVRRARGVPGFMARAAGNAGDAVAEVSRGRADRRREKADRTHDDRLAGIGQGRETDEAQRDARVEAAQHAAQVDSAQSRAAITRAAITRAGNQTRAGEANTRMIEAGADQQQRADRALAEAEEVQAGLQQTRDIRRTAASQEEAAKALVRMAEASRKALPAAREFAANRDEMYRLGVATSNEPEAGEPRQGGIRGIVRRALDPGTGRPTPGQDRAAAENDRASALRREGIMEGAVAGEVLSRDPVIEAEVRRVADEDEESRGTVEPEHGEEVASEDVASPKITDESFPTGPTDDEDE